MLRSTPPLRAASALVAAAATAVAVACLPASASAAAAAPPQDPIHDLARRLVLQAAQPWPALQRGDGSYVDRIHKHTPYGESVLGYALIDAGIREHQPRLWRSGLRALVYAVHRRGSLSRTSVFENTAIAASWNLGRKRLAGTPEWQRVRHTLRTFLSGRTLYRLAHVDRHYGNHQLVESIGALEYARSGIRSAAQGAFKGPPLGSGVPPAHQLLAGVIPRLVGGGIYGPGHAALLSDPPDDPLAYQGLSLGFYARARALLGRRSRAKTGLVLRRTALASWELGAPDGDFGYIGRNQEEAWILAGTAYGAYTAASLPGIAPSVRARYTAVAQRALDRLVAAHMGGPDGLAIVPGLRADPNPRNTLMVDGSAGSAPFVGLTLLFLNYIADGPPRSLPAPAPLFSDSDGVTVLGRGEAKFATARRDDVWLAVRAHPSFHRFTDLRYDGGLVALKRRQPDGSWLDLMSRRPHVVYGPPDSAGPLLRTRAGPRVLSGDRLTPVAGAGLRLSGAYRPIGQPRGGVHGGVETVRPTACGATVTFAGRAGERLEYSLFLPDRAVARSPGSVAAGSALVSFDPASATVALRRGYQSASDPRVVRVRLRWRPTRARSVRVTICQRPG